MAVSAWSRVAVQLASRFIASSDLEPGSAVERLRLQPRGGIGAGQGGSLGPLTASGIVDVAPEDAGAASGLVNVAHQLGGSLGLGILVTVFATAGTATGARDLLARRVSTSLTAGTAMLAVALMLVVMPIARPGRTARTTPA